MSCIIFLLFQNVKIKVVCMGYLKFVTLYKDVLLFFLSWNSIAKFVLLREGEGVSVRTRGG